MSEPLELDELLYRAIFDARPGLQHKLDQDPDAYLDLVALVAQARATTSDLLTAAVRAARGAGHSWESIGILLGISRQAAQQRFSEHSDDDLVGETKKLSPLTAFDEMETLAREGQFGWHSIGFGTLYHLMERSDVQWEHLRVVATSGQRKELERTGWSRIGKMWFPWAYYTRATEQPALSR